MSYKDEEWLREKYVDEALEVREIAELCDCARSTVSTWISNFNLERKHREEDWLREKYHGEGLRLVDMADLANVSKSAIIRWMDKHDIDRRDSGYSQAEGPHKDEGWLREKYVDEKFSQKEIADMCDVGKGTIKYWLDKHEIPIRDKSEAAEIRAERYPHTHLTQADIEKGENWWNRATEKEREKFREWLSKRRKGENNPMAGRVGPDHPNWKEDKPSHRFYQSKRWKEVREEALEKSNHQCEACGDTEQLVGHHIIPLSEGGEPLDVDNVSILCRSCHGKWEGLYLKPDVR